jgi:hypothetical protein
VPETTFGVAYGGPALATGRMPVRDLAPALLALGELFSMAGGVLYPELDPVAVKVEATKEGSFFVHLLIEAEDAWDQLVGLFGSKDASALINLRDAVLAGGIGLFWLIKKLGLRKVKSLERPDAGTVRLKLDDHTTLDIPSETWLLYRNVEVRKHTRSVVEPLSREGIEVIRFTAEHAEPIEIAKDDLPAFAIVEGDQEALLEQEQEMFVEIVLVAFIRGNKWRLGLGDHTFWASVIDEDFLDRVDSGEEAFRKGDVLRCLMTITQTRDAEGLHTEYVVIDVREHLPRPTQLILGDDPEEPRAPRNS